jgi:Na+(H+)/acetate symporter ActP
MAAFRPLAGPEDPAPLSPRARLRAALLVLGAGAFACLAPAGSWAVLLLALGVAASSLAPAAALVGWSRRATPGGVAAGVTVGLLTFVVVATAGVLSTGGPAEQWWSAVAAAPAAVAVPAHILLAWGLRSRRTASQRLPAGLDGLTAAPPARTG